MAKKSFKPKLPPMLGKALKSAAPMGAGPAAPPMAPAPPRVMGNPSSNLGMAMARAKAMGG